MCIRDSLSINLSTFFAETISESQPPILLESVSLPSLNAPAPPHPLNVLHGLQRRHEPEGARHSLCSIPFPLSTRSILRSLERESSRAQKMPAGPAPTMMTS